MKDDNDGSGGEIGGIAFAFAPGKKRKMNNALSILYIQKFFGLYCHARIAWSDKNKKE